MSSKPKITGRPGAYVCRSRVASLIDLVGRGATPWEAWEAWSAHPAKEVCGLPCQLDPGDEYAPGMRKILARLYGSDGK